MTIREMHIEVRQGINQVAANRTRKLQDEEIDAIINKITERYKRSLIRPRPDGSGGFEVDQINVDSIRTLIVPSYDLTPYYKGTGLYQCILPPDYQYLLADWSVAVNLHGKPLPTPEVEIVQLNMVKQPLSAKSGTPYYTTELIHLGSQTLSIPTDLNLGNTYTGLVNKVDIDSLVPWITLSKGWYWEYYGDSYFPNSYLSPSGVSGTNNIAVDSGATIQGSVRQYTFNRFTGQGSRHSNRLTNTSKIANMLSTAYYRPAYNTPISELAGRQLNIYSDNSFTIVGAGISYIRKCVPVSLSLGCNSELPETVHSVICDLVIEHLLSTFNTPNVQFKQGDIQSRVTL